MSYGIEIFDENGVRTLGMGDFTYSKIWEESIPAATSSSSTAPYNVTVPGYSDSNCVVVFTPINYVTGAQGSFIPANPPGFVPVYRSPGGEVVSVLRRVLGQYYDAPNNRYINVYSTTPACTMEVFRVFGG